MDKVCQRLAKFTLQTYRKKQQKQHLREEFLKYCPVIICFFCSRSILWVDKVRIHQHRISHLMRTKHVSKNHMNISTATIVKQIKIKLTCFSAWSFKPSIQLYPTPSLNCSFCLYNMCYNEGRGGEGRGWAYSIFFLA